MKVLTEAIKEVRDRTSIGIVDCKDALIEAGGDVEKAIEVLKARGLGVAGQKTKRVTRDGVIEAYIHHNKRIGALVELNCETDFVAGTDEFKELARNIAMQVAAMSPQFVTSEEMPKESELDPQTSCLLLQPFIKDPTRTIREVIAEVIAKVGENIKVGKFTRFELGC